MHENLLKAGETEVPTKVRATYSFFEEHGLWFILSRNLPAKGCRDAANKRNRLGNTGIPIEDELKTFLGKFSSHHTVQYVMIHCRGDEEICSTKCREMLGTKNLLERLPESELYEVFDMENGTVNPFVVSALIDSTLSVIHIFDKGLMETPRPPYTMMTNAGDFSWGIEFKIGQIIEKISNTLIGDIKKDRDSKQKDFRSIGIITGNPPEAGMLLWRKVNERIRQAKGNQFIGDLSFPKILISSIPALGLSMELDKRECETWRELESEVINLCLQGITLLVIPCNTLQYFNEKVKNICNKYHVTYLSVNEVLYEFICQNKLKQFAFLGIEIVANFGSWSGYKSLGKFETEKLSAKELKTINKLAYRFKRDGVTENGLNKLRDLLNQIVESKNIVIALTELSVLFDHQKNKKRSNRIYIDTLELLINSIMDNYIS